MGKVRYCVFSQDMVEDISIRCADAIIETLIEMYPFLIYHSITFMSTYVEVWFKVDERECQKFKLLGGNTQTCMEYDNIRPSARISDIPQRYGGIMLLRIIITPSGGTLTEGYNGKMYDFRYDSYRKYLSSILPDEAEFKLIFHSYAPIFQEDSPLYVFKCHYVFEMTVRNFLLRKMTNPEFVKFLNHELYDRYSEPPEIVVQEATL